jgi:hypothetical protein
MLLGTFFDVENPMKVGEYTARTNAGKGGTFGCRWNQREAEQGTHDSCLRTDYAGNATSAVTASAEGRDDAGNSRRDSAARTATIRRDGNAGDGHSLACQREADSPESTGPRSRVEPDEGGSSRTLKGNQAHGRHE